MVQPGTKRVASRQYVLDFPNRQLPVLLADAVGATATGLELICALDAATARCAIELDQYPADPTKLPISEILQAFINKQFVIVFYTGTT